MRYLVIAAVGAILGLASIWLGFHFRIGGPGSSLWLSGSAAYMPAAIVGAVAALLVDFIVRKWV